jgi:rSAM/selenodomain-associated transferase 1
MRAERLLVFARAPVAGAAKTRLAPALGAAGAARLAAALIEHALAAATASRAGEIELWCSPDCTHPLFLRLACESGARLREQRGADLGVRMAHALGSALARGRRPVLIGCDAPALDAAEIDRAFDALAAGDDAVLLPVEDGGYALVGISRPLPALFSGIGWGSARVYAESVAALERSHARWSALATGWDIDRPADLARLAAFPALARAAAMR